MLEREFQISELIGKYFRGELDDSEQQRLNAWLSESEANQKFFKELSLDDTIKTRLEILNSASEPSIWNKISNKLDLQNGSYIREHRPHAYLYKISVAAAIFIAFCITVWLFKPYWQKSDIQSQIAEYHSVGPGSNTATLTLANGKKIRLANANIGQLAEEAGISITKTADGQIFYKVSPQPAGADPSSLNTVSTNKGETYKIRLPDGSLVWLNAASSITYAPALILNGKRSVKLDGEAYFEIFKDKTHPFVVKSKGQEVEVLGTHFNVNAYADELFVKTTLIEGRIGVTGNGFEKILSPNQQSILDHSDHIVVKEVNGTDAIDWKNGEFVFKSESLRQILRRVARWYSVDIAYEKDIPDYTFTGTMSRFDDISGIINLIEATGKVKFEIQGKKLIVKQ